MTPLARACRRLAELTAGEGLLLPQIAVPAVLLGRAARLVALPRLLALLTRAAASPGRSRLPFAQAERDPAQLARLADLAARVAPGTGRCLATRGHVSQLSPDALWQSATRTTWHGRTILTMAPGDRLRSRSACERCATGWRRSAPCLTRRWRSSGSVPSTRGRSWRRARGWPETARGKWRCLRRLLAPPRGVRAHWTPGAAASPLSWYPAWVLAAGRAAVRQATTRTTGG